MNTLVENKFDLEQGLPPPSWKTVLVPVDFSAGSARATKLGAEIGQQNGGKIVVLHVIAPPSGSEDADFCFLDEAERQAAARLNQWVTTHLADFLCETDTCVRVSSSLEFTIVLEARRFGADVIVLSQSRDAMLGTQGTVWNAGTSTSHGALFRMPAKARGILRHASCPIVTVNEAFPKPEFDVGAITAWHWHKQDDQLARSCIPAFGLTEAKFVRAANIQRSITMKTTMTTRSIYITEADEKRLGPLIEALKNSRDDIRALQSELELANVVAPADIPADVITMNSKARLRDLDIGEEVIYTLVFPDRASIDDGLISVVAPVGTAMLGHRVGDEFEWEVPAGGVRFRVEEVLYQPEAAGHYHL